MKKKFIITEKKPAVYIWTYEIEAETEEQAIELIRYGEVNEIEFTTDCELSEDSDFDIEEINN